ncbi:uncharacterized protein CCR75_006639 [Bremia lactucae]|uniref:Uncharacterized protein n=1 Tax=Bremia lactucae TaxID=4779 RepID=A0A976IAJ6_BRELC|nr:hypothetical protein CCR75_006639 [Bremia lactucae]
MIGQQGPEKTIRNHMHIRQSIRNSNQYRRTSGVQLPCRGDANEPAFGCSVSNFSVCTVQSTTPRHSLQATYSATLYYIKLASCVQIFDDSLQKVEGEVS